MELVPMAEFMIVTRSSSSAWIVLPTLGLAGSFLNGAPLMA
jgi:hypothetical protein